MLISHYQFLIDEENCTWNLETSIRGSKRKTAIYINDSTCCGSSVNSNRIWF
jgi:hypothetical protein